TDANYGHPSLKLSPGLKFMVKVFQITDTVSSDDCLKFLKAEKGVLLGAQGASLAYEQGKQHLIKGRWHASFDEKENLWEDSGRYRRVPDVRANSGGGFDFHLGLFEYPWDAGHCLLCFCDE
ncbi:MAG: hypothetical protein Q7S19_01370, partial [bacterium]|nr:hypothetical protein [bacterium]